MNLFVIFNAQVSEKSMGGGDKIVLSTVKEALMNDSSATFLGCPEGIGMMKSVLEVKGILLNNIRSDKFGLILSYVLRILTSHEILNIEIPRNSIVWSASDFLPDTVPGFIEMLFRRDILWYGNMFLKARNPTNGEIEFSIYNLLSYVNQKLSLLLYKMKATCVFVLCEADKKYLQDLGFTNDKICIFKVGVDSELFKNVPTQRKYYDAIFIGRFHQQKGLDILVDIWYKLVSIGLGRKLAIIGWGGDKERNQLNEALVKSGLTATVEFLGFLDGAQKVEKLKASKLLLFPSTFESWGLVVLESLASGVPVVAFDLPVLKEHYGDLLIYAKSFDKDDYFEKVKGVLLSNLPQVDTAKIFSEFSWKNAYKLLQSYENIR